MYGMHVRILNEKDDKENSIKLFVKLKSRVWDDV